MPEAEGWNEPVTASDDTAEEVVDLCKGKGERWRGIVVKARARIGCAHSDPVISIAQELRGRMAMEVVAGHGDSLNAAAPVAALGFFSQFSCIFVCLAPISVWVYSDYSEAAPNYNVVIYRNLDFGSKPLRRSMVLNSIIN